MKRLLGTRCMLLAGLVASVLVTGCSRESPASSPAIHTAGEQAQQQSAAEILFIGDSNTEMGYISNRIKDIMEARGGYTGSGYTSLNEDFFTPKRWGVRVVNDIHWSKYDMAPPSGPPKLPVDAPHGMWVTGATPESATLVHFRGAAVDVYYLAQPGGGSFIVEIDGQQKKLVSTSAKTRKSEKVSIGGLSNTELHKMRLIIQEGTVSLQGFDAWNGKIRGIVHSWGNSSAATKDFAAIDEEVFISGLSLLNPGVVVILLGTNDYYVHHLSAEQFRDNLITLVNRTKKALPESRVLLVSTFDTNTPDKKTLMEQYLAISYPEAQKATGCDYWDMNAWFGPYSKAYMFDDLHVNEEGGRKIGDALWAQIQAL